METMRVAVLPRPREVQIEERAIPVPSPEEVLVRIRCTGVCRSDVHYYQIGRIGRYTVERPLILGHECAGEVVAAGHGERSPISVRSMPAFAKMTDGFLYVASANPKVHAEVLSALRIDGIHAV